MNQFLAASLRKINAFTALAILVLPGLAFLMEHGPLRPVIGILAGVSIAALVEGVLAILLEIERHLYEINETRARARCDRNDLGTPSPGRMPNSLRLARTSRPAATAQIRHLQIAARRR